MKNLKVIYKLIIAFVIILLLFSVTIYINIKTTGDVYNTMTEFYDHPYSVSNAVKSLIIKIDDIDNLIDEFFEETDSGRLMQKELLIAQAEEEVRNQIKIVEENFLGDKDKVEALSTAFIDLSEYNHEIIRLINDGDTDAARQMRTTGGKLFRENTYRVTEELLLVANYYATSFIEQSTKAYRNQEKTVGFVSIGLLLLVSGIAFFLSRSIVNPLNKLVDAIEMAKTPDSKIELDALRKDEIGVVWSSFRKMIDYNREREKLQISRQKKMFSSLFENIHLGTSLNRIIYDEFNNAVDYILIDANKSFYETLELDKVNYFTDFEDRFKERFFNLILLSNIQNSSLSEEMDFKDIEKTLAVTIFPASRDDIVMLIEDITEKKAAERTIRDMNVTLEKKVGIRTKQLENSNRELEAFSYSVSHDLRAPLRHIIGYIELLEKKHSDELSEEALRYLGIIEGATEKMNDLINGLLEFSRTGRKEVEKKRFSQNEMVESLLEAFKVETQDRGIRWKVGKLGESYADPSLISLVWQNIIGNAVKYSSKENEAVIEIGKYIQGEYDVFYVKDNGVGFDMKYYDKIFTVFQRLHSDSEFEGIGIGLANAQRIVLMHEGEIWAESKVGEGSIFSFKLRRE